MWIGSWIQLWREKYPSAVNNSSLLGLFEFLKWWWTSLLSCSLFYSRKAFFIQPAQIHCPSSFNVCLARSTQWHLFWDAWVSWSWRFRWPLLKIWMYRSPICLFLLNLHHQGKGLQSISRSDCKQGMKKRQQALKEDVMGSHFEQRGIFQSAVISGNLSENNWGKLKEKLR